MGSSERQRWKERNRNQRPRERKINVNNSDSQKGSNILHLATIVKINCIIAHTSANSPLWSFTTGTF